MVQLAVVQVGNKLSVCLIFKAFPLPKIPPS